MLKSCRFCNKDFELKTNGQRYCSIECSKEARKLSKKKWYQLSNYKEVEKKRKNNEPLEKREKRLSKKKDYYKKNSKIIIQKAIAYNKTPKGSIIYKKNQKIYYDKNKKELIAKSSMYQRKRYLEDAEYRSKSLAYAKTYRKKDSMVQWRRDYVNQKYNTDINFKIGINLFNRIKQAIKGYNKGSKRTISLLGCSIVEFRDYFEKKFKPGMSWNNHGIKGWHIDHIKPIASFDLSKETEQVKCFHYTNLQPLWAEENLKKSDNY